MEEYRDGVVLLHEKQNVESYGRGDLNEKLRSNQRFLRDVAQRPTEVQYERRHP